MTDKEIDSDSDAPEEFTAHQGLQQDEELRKVQRENKSRVAREGKERRRQRAQKLTPRSRPKERKSEKDETETEINEDTEGNKGMLPDDIVKLLAANEKKVFTSDSEDEQVDQKPASKKRKPKKFGLPRATASPPDDDPLSDEGFILRFGDFPPATYDVDGLVIEFGTHGFDELDDPSPTYSTTPKGSFVVLEPVILKDIPTAQCVQKSLDFLKKRKMQVSRSSAVLDNSNQALRLLSNTGLLK
ncbi:hypothetical protein CASFOL_018802 [Castilleja foliolosa]|uniref:Uncharacterized protein n=1 Tax=Castilleja foliolosa TaxID=1961234 RepID=A0ABD3D2N3_9LAMI